MKYEFMENQNGRFDTKCEKVDDKNNFVKICQILIWLDSFLMSDTIHGGKKRDILLKRDIHFLREHEGHHANYYAFDNQNRKWY